MCGIVGYNGKREAYPILIKGLKRLKYRGYDSAGVAIINDNQLLNVYRPQGETFVFASDGIIETPTVILQEFPSQSYIFRNSTYTEVPVYSFSSFRPMHQFCKITASRAVRPETLKCSDSLIIREAFSDTLLQGGKDEATGIREESVTME